MKRTLLLMAGSCLAAQLMAGELIGVVKDKKTGEVLIGSTVQVKELPKNQNGKILRNEVEKILKINSIGGTGAYGKI